jgi:dihydrofolate reductase
MRPVRYNVAASLDGFIADAKDGFAWIPEDPAVDFAAIFARIDTVLIGRRTYEVVLRGGERPWQPGTRIYVFSSRLVPAEHPDVTVVSGDAAATVAALRAEAGEGEIWLFGGGRLFAALLAAGQVDAVEVTVVPVILGSGVPLAGPGTPLARLRLQRTQQYPSGMISLVYEVER